MKKVSVVIPTYNRKSCLVKLIDSFLAQTEYLQEIIVVDDGSTDGTFELIKSLDNPLVRIFRIENSERGAARNYGASKASGQYINFFDSDDYAYPSHCKTAIDIAVENEDPPWIITNFKVENRNTCSVYTGPSLSNPLILSLVNGNPLSINSVFIRKDIALSNCFNDLRDLSGSEDYELWIRLALLHEPFISSAVTSVVVDHEGRSVNTIKPEKALRQLKLLMHIIENLEILNCHPSCKRKILSNLSSYLSLQLSCAPGYRRKSLYYSVNSLAYSINLNSIKKSLVTARNLLISSIKNK